MKFVTFPYGYVKSSDGKLTLKYNANAVNRLQKNLNETQIFLDNKVIIYLQQYVSKKEGIQEASIRLSSLPGSGKVHINVPYAEYQAYSKRIKKRVGKRGTQPFERMCADKASSILTQTAEYSRRINK